MRVEHADLLIAGAGPAGLAAAAEAARCGARVLVVDEAPAPGGCLRFQLERADADGGTAWRVGAAESARLSGEAAGAGARIACGVSVWGLFPGWEAHLSPADPGADGERPDVVRARAIIAATGAAQKALGIPGWTLPGVLSPAAVQMLVNVQRVRPGRRAVIVGTDLLGIQTAGQLAAAGVEVLGVLPPVPGPYVADPAVALQDAARAASTWGVAVRRRQGVQAIVGDDRARGVSVVPLDAGGAPAGAEERWEVDLVVISGGLCPLVNLVQAAGCPVTYIAELGGHVPLHGPDLETPLAGVFVAGSVAGAVGAEAAEAHGRFAGLSAAARLGLDENGRATGRLARARDRSAAALAAMPPLIPDAANGLARLAERWRAVST